jgi:hypothetical protein
MKPGELVKDAIKEMLKRHISCVIITDDDELKGLVTKRDLLEIVAAMQKQEGEQFFIKTTGEFDKVDSFEKAQIEKALNQFAGKLSDKFQQGYLIADLKEHKEQTRKVPLMYCKIRFSSDLGMFVSSNHGWGALAAVTKGLDNIKRQMDRQAGKKREYKTRWRRKRS